MFINCTRLYSKIGLCILMYTVYNDQEAVILGRHSSGRCFFSFIFWSDLSHVSPPCSPAAMRYVLARAPGTKNVETKSWWGQLPLFSQFSHFRKAAGVEGGCGAKEAKALFGAQPSTSTFPRILHNS